MDLQRKKYGGAKVTWTPGEQSRWSYAVGRAEIHFGSLALTVPKARKQLAAIHEMKQRAGTAITELQQTGAETNVTFEVGRQDRLAMMAVAKVAALELLDDTKPEAHAGLMGRLYGGQVNSYYRPLAAEVWLQDGTQLEARSVAPGPQPTGV